MKNGNVLGKGPMSLAQTFDNANNDSGFGDAASNFQPQSRKQVGQDDDEDVMYARGLMPAGDSMPEFPALNSARVGGDLPVIDINDVEDHGVSDDELGDWGLDHDT